MCDPRLVEDCDLSEIIEALQSLSEIEDPFAQLRDVAKMQLTMASFAVGIIPLLQFVIPMALYYGKYKNRLAS